MRNIASVRSTLRVKKLVKSAAPVVAVQGFSAVGRYVVSIDGTLKAIRDELRDKFATINKDLESIRGELDELSSAVSGCAPSIGLISLGVEPIPIPYKTFDPIPSVITPADILPLNG